MASSRLKKIRIEAFRTFVDPVEVELPEQGLVLIRGDNKDTKGGSGAGKTNLLHSIAYALKYCPLPATELQSWHTDTKMKVSLDLVVDGKLVSVTRGRSHTVIVDGEKVEGSVALKDEALTKVLGLSSDLLSIMTYRTQKSGGLFLSRKDSEKKDLLTTLLSLEPFEAAVEAAEANIKKLKVSLEVAKKEEERLKAETDTLLAQIPTPQIPDIGLLEEQLQVALDQVSTLKAQNDRAQVALREAQDAKKIAEEDAMAAYADDIAAAKSVVQDIKLSVLPAVATQEDLDKLAQLELLYAEAGERKQSLVKLDKDKEMEQLREKAQLKRDLDAARSQSARTAEYKDTISKLQGQLAVLAKHECYTCHQPWTNSSLQKDKAALEQKIEETRAMLTEAKRADKRAKELVQQLHDRDWTFLPDPTIAELAKVEAALLNQVVEAKGAVESANARATAQRAQKLQEAQEVLSALEHESRESCRTVTESKAHEVDIAREAAHSFSTQLAAASAARDLAAKELSLANQTKKYELAREEEAQNRYHTARRALERAVAHLEDVGTSLAAEKDFVALVGRKGFLGAIFDEVLDEIAAEANRILGSVPNTSHVTIAFPSESQTKAGTTKIEIIPALTIGGKTATLKSLSGGMDSVVALAVDLALTRVVSQRTGHAPGWLILDESFEGLGATEKEGCLNILQDYAQERLVLIVDHSSVLQEHFDVILGVESTQDRSSIVAT